MSGRHYKLPNALEALRSIVGPEAADDHLNILLKAYSNDVERAANGFFDGAAVEPAAPPPPPPPPSLPSGWKAVTSAEGKTYYYHAESGAVQWDHPQPPAAAALHEGMDR